jgi:hypothetical protein
MRYLRAFLLGGAAIGVLAFAGLAVISSAATSGAVADVHVGLAGVVLLDVRRVADGTETTVGAGLPLLCLAGGALNMAMLAVLSRRGREPGPIA